MSGVWPNKYTHCNIASGQSLSQAMLIPGRLTGIQMPSSWTTANLTFQGSLDGVTFTNIYDAFGNEVTVDAAASELITIDDLQSQTYLKVRSGTSGTPVTQGAARVLLLQEVRRNIPF